MSDPVQISDPTVVRKPATDLSSGGDPVDNDRAKDGDCDSDGTCRLRPPPRCVQPPAVPAVDGVAPDAAPRGALPLPAVSGDEGNGVAVVDGECSDGAPWMSCSAMRITPVVDHPVAIFACTQCFLYGSLDKICCGRPITCGDEDNVLGNGVGAPTHKGYLALMAAGGDLVRCERCGEAVALGTRHCGAYAMGDDD